MCWSYWFHIDQDRDKCRAVVNTIMNLPFSHSKENCLTGWLLWEVYALRIQLELIGHVLRMD
jgi:hypothetical protein